MIHGQWKSYKEYADSLSKYVAVAVSRWCNRGITGFESQSLRMVLTAVSY